LSFHTLIRLINGVAVYCYWGCFYVDVFVEFRSHCSKQQIDSARLQKGHISTVALHTMT